MKWTCTLTGRLCWQRIFLKVGSLRVCVWLYLALVLMVWLLTRFAGDRWWFATLLLFGPRWLCLLPLAVLVPLALVFRRRSLGPLLAAAFVALGPLCGFCVPWARFSARGSPSIRGFTCNIKSHDNDNGRNRSADRPFQPDIVALQGCWGENVKWPDGWHVLRSGELLVASRSPLREISVASHADNGGQPT